MGILADPSGKASILVVFRRSEYDQTNQLILRTKRLATVGGFDERVKLPVGGSVLITKWDQ